MAALAKTTAMQATRQVMPDDHSELVPPLPIPNRTVKRLCADDSAATSVKVGHRQAVTPKHPLGLPLRGCLLLEARTPSAALLRLAATPLSPPSPPANPLPPDLLEIVLLITGIAGMAMH